MNTKKAVRFGIGVITITVVGTVIIPKMMRRISSKMYKASYKSDKNKQVDDDDFEPKIVKKNTEQIENKEV